MPAFKRLAPSQRHRRHGRDRCPLPDYVQRQSAIEGLIGEELEAAVTGQKPVEQALADAERRVNELLAQILSS